MAADAEAWVRLIRTPGVGPRAAALLLEHVETPRDWYDADPAERRQLLANPRLARLLDAAPDRAGVDADLAWLEAPDHHLITLRDSRYPDGLRTLHDPPPALFVAGDPQLLRQPQLAIVGSRNATGGGVANARAFATDLAGRGLAVTSGLALGIDTAAHRGALDAGGATLAVIGTGPDRIYPARNRDLARDIAACGAIVSEFATGVGARREHFPRRNRLISGLSLGVLVVEAGLRSGSLLTARHALDQGREVFAIPGSIHNPVSRGCHALIREGAKLVESSSDVIDELPPLERLPAPSADPQPTPVAAADGDESALLDALGHDAEPLDTLLQRTGLTPDKLSSMLLLLELRGLVVACPGGRYARIGR
jgi:DNA processing protein